MKAVYIMDKQYFDLVYEQDTKNEIGQLLGTETYIHDEAEIITNPEILNEVEIIFASWGMIKLDEELLEQAPKLKAVFYAAGTIKYFVTDAFWNNNILISSAYSANAIPVAEFTFAQIIFSLKRGWELMRNYKEEKQWNSLLIRGCYKSTVGLISLGEISLHLRKMLKALDVHVLVYSTHASAEMAKELDVEFCTLDEIFQRSDVVSLHTPWLKQTEGMVTGRHFAKMKQGATFINTARGAVINEEEMLNVLQNRTDLYAVLDVTHPEPPIPNSSLYTLPNVIITPHIAGSKGCECGRMGAYMLEECKRYLNGDALKWQITREMIEKMA